MDWVCSVAGHEWIYGPGESRECRVCGRTQIYADQFGCWVDYTPPHS